MRAYLICLLPLCASGAALAESMRCDKWVVNETASVAELVEKCGEPLSKESEIEDVMAYLKTLR